MPIETENLWNRISLAFIDFLGTDEPEEIRKALGFKSVQAVYKWRKGDMPGLDAIIAISDVTGCSIHWLLTAKGSMKTGDQVGPNEGVNLDQLKLKAIQDFLVQKATEIAEKRRELEARRLLGHQVKEKP
jgi:hypothetical protein